MSIVTSEHPTREPNPKLGEDYALEDRFRNLHLAAERILYETTVESVDCLPREVYQREEIQKLGTRACKLAMQIDQAPFTLSALIAVIKVEKLLIKNSSPEHADAIKAIRSTILLSELPNFIPFSSVKQAILELADNDAQKNSIYDQWMAITNDLVNEAEEARLAIEREQWRAEDKRAIEEA